MKKLKILKISLLTLLASSIANATCKNPISYQIATGSKTGTYYEIGKNLAKYVAPDACINLEAINSNGSMHNMKMLRSPNYPQMKFAIVQHDAFNEVKRLAELGDRDMQDLVNNLRVVKALYNEEIHIIANSDSNINTYADLKGKKLSVGPVGSGTAMTSLLLYNELFGSDPRDEQIKFEKFDKALDSLDAKQVDAIITVAGQPVTKLATFTSDAKNFIKLVRYDQRSTQGESSYYPTYILKENYSWLEDNVETLSTKAYLITYNYTGDTKKHIRKFSKVLNQKVKTLQQNATKSIDTPHLKWKQIPIECNTLLPGDWEYYSATKEVCGNVNVSPSQPGCTSRNRALGRCQ